MKYSIILMGLIILIGIVIVAILFLNRGGEEQQTPNTESKFDCSLDMYNCEDFDTQEQAQEAFDFCKSEGDVYNLDLDDDGVVCEGLR